MVVGIVNGLGSKGKFDAKAPELTFGHISGAFWAAKDGVMREGIVLRAMARQEAHCEPLDVYSLTKYFVYAHLGPDLVLIIFLVPHLQQFP